MRTRCILPFLLILALIASIAAAKTDKKAPKRLVKEHLPAAGVSDRSLGWPQSAAALTDTFVLGEFDFEGMGGGDPQGWTTRDMTNPHDVYFHIDDFAGLPPGYQVQEGNQVAWCGARESTTDDILCGYAALPGYGNNWNQSWESVCFAVTGDVHIDYYISYWTEPGYDDVDIDYDQCDGNWVNLRTHSGTLDEFQVDNVAAASHGGNVRFRFHFDSDGAWSDEDGLWDTDGAVWIDSVSVIDASGTIDFQDFESESVGDTQTSDGNWQGKAGPSFGDFAGLFPGTAVAQDDPCQSNLSHFWGFFNGSTYDYSCGGHPSQMVVPYGPNADGQYIYSAILSPRFDWDLDENGLPIPGSATEVVIEWDQYSDLAQNALISWTWRVRSIIGGCPGTWQDFASGIYFDDSREWHRRSLSVGSLIEPGIEELQILLGAWDTCGFFCGVSGTGACHSHGPLYDNVRISRVDVAGPRWYVFDHDLFQDNFSGDGTVTGTVRADRAADILYNTSPNILPGDSAVVEVADPISGLAGDPYTGAGPAVYAYVSVWPQGQPGKDGANLTDDGTRWPVVDSMVVGGDTWYCVRLDTVRQVGGNIPNDNWFCVDLNDDLFTPGDTICFYFGAENTVGKRTYLSGPSRPIYSVPYETAAEAQANAFEFTCLPANALNGATDILYVDDASGWGAQPYFDDAFALAGVTPDRYDVRRPWAAVGNGPASRVQNVAAQLNAVYKKIIWNTGDLPGNLIGDGDLFTGEKSDDYQMLVDFLDQGTNDPGLYLSGNHLAEEWSSIPGGSALPLRSFMNYSLVSGDHASVGEPLSAPVVGQPGGCFYHGSADAFVAFGGCPAIRDYDVILPAGTATLEMAYSDDPTHGAVLGQVTTNSQNASARVLLSGFSFHDIRDDVPAGIPDRVEHLVDILNWLQNTVDQPTPAGTGKPTYSLRQNYPNPFNPRTSVRFTLAERGHVTVRIYNVAGELVRTLVDDVLPAGELHTAEWDGRSDGGESVSSGVYFYRLESQSYTRTRKMVLLK